MDIRKDMGIYATLNISGGATRICKATRSDNYVRQNSKLEKLLSTIIQFFRTDREQRIASHFKFKYIKYVCRWNNT